MTRLARLGVALLLGALVNITFDAVFYDALHAFWAFPLRWRIEIILFFAVLDLCFLAARALIH